MRQRSALFVLAAALVLVAVAQARTEGSVYGTWIGTPRVAGKSGPGYRYDPVKLVVGTAHMQVDSTGPTIASHDAPSATSTCTTRYRFNSVLSRDGWRVYVQEAATKISGAVSGGQPSYGVCGASLAAFRDAVRLRPAGTKLRVEFGGLKASEKVLAPDDFSPAFYKRGYFHR
jgi:hypothetical protein